MFKYKKGSTGKNVSVLIGVLLLVVMVGALAPTIFANLSTVSGAPSWVNLTLPIIAGAGIVMMVWRAFN